MKSALATMGRFLTFRASSAELQNLNWSHLAWGFFFVWLAGIGRSWDNAEAGLWRHLGVGSLIYVFALAALMATIIAPFFGTTDWRVYRRALTAICLTAPPALLYAIPVEAWMSASAARAANYSLLAIVALWRVALWMFYLRRGALFSWPRVLACTLLALCVIVGIFGALGLGSAVMNAMAGARSPEQQAAEDSAARFTGALFLIAAVSFFPLLIFYTSQSFQAVRERRDAEHLEIVNGNEDSDSS